MIFRTKKLVCGLYLFLFITLLALTVSLIIRFGESEGSFFPNATFVLVTLLIGCGFLISIFSKITFFSNHIEINVIFVVYKIKYTEIQDIVKDDFPGRYFILTKDGKKASLSLTWFQNSSQILPLLYEKMNSL